MIVASPALLILAIPFGYGFTGDLLDAAGPPASVACTAAVCLASLLWARYRSRCARQEAPRQRVANTVGRTN